MTNPEGESLPADGIKPTPLIDKYLGLDRDAMYPTQEAIRGAYDYLIPNVIPLSVVDVPQFSMFLEPDTMPLDIATEERSYMAGGIERRYRFLLRAGPNRYPADPSPTMVTIHLDLMDETIFGEGFISIASLNKFSFDVRQEKIPTHIPGSNSDLAGFLDLFEKLQQQAQ
jgi:hypothetical protein